MKIVSWNVNGIRSLSKDMGTILEELGADIACFQETKISKDQVTENLAIVHGYRSYFSYCKRKAGYSGVVTYCKNSMQPMRAADSLTAALQDETLDSKDFTIPESELKSLDNEGRCVITQHLLKEPIEGKSTLTVFNLYCPCVSGEVDGREQFRLQFLQLLEERVRQLKKTSFVILTGDMNVAHKIIDHCDPGDENLFADEPHRLWFDRIVGASGCLIDTYRHLNPQTKFAYTCWNTRTNARQTNAGTRIDYVLLDSDLKQCLVNAEVHAKYYGSDHCPVSACLEVGVTPSSTLPSICSSFRFKKRQQKLTMFMMKRPADNDAFKTLDDPQSKKKSQSSKRSKSSNLDSFLKSKENAP